MHPASSEKSPPSAKTSKQPDKFLANLEQQADKVKVGIVSESEIDIASHRQTPITEHLEVYLNI